MFRIKNDWFTRSYIFFFSIKTHIIVLKIQKRMTTRFNWHILKLKFIFVPSSKLNPPHFLHKKHKKKMMLIHEWSAINLYSFQVCASPHLTNKIMSIIFLLCFCFDVVCMMWEMQPAFYYWIRNTYRMNVYQKTKKY